MHAFHYHWHGTAHILHQLYPQLVHISHSWVAELWAGVHWVDLFLDQSKTPQYVAPLPGASPPLWHQPYPIEISTASYVTLKCFL